ncbi:MAG TPA: hypothetical protein PKV48_06650, partial [Thermodesulfobacteriota bacterium]|nr:hypothetical protein [Thermodesulfobacteriota bacterium]
GKLKKYLEWHCLSPGIQEASLLLFPTGVGGVLYPPHSLSEEVIDEKAFMQLAPYHDDVWLKAMSLLKGTQCKKVSSFCPKYTRIRGVRKRTLNKINLANEGKKADEQIQAVFEHYNLYNLL